MTDPKDRSPILTCRDLTVTFTTEGESTEVTHAVSFELKRGRTLALVGESGSGKSVTAMSLVGLLPGTASITGSARFDGEELIGATEERLRSLRGSGIGVIFQEPMTALNPVYTVRALLREALRAHGMHAETQIRLRSVELLQLVGMPDPEKRLGFYPHQLSGGQRQRCMIALAISGNPGLLIADEPTTALDVTVQADILALLRSLQDQLGMAMLFITHDMGVVAEVADSVCVMKDGRVVEQSDVFTLFRSPDQPYTRDLLAAVPELHVSGPSADEPSREEAADDVVLELRSLSVRYPGGFRRPPVMAVDSVDLRLARGTTVGLVGESGSGKSTIGRVIVGLVEPTSGGLVINGSDLTSLRPRQRRAARRNASIVFQDPASSLNPRSPIGKTVVEPLVRRGALRGHAESRRRAGSLLEQVSLPASWIDRYPHELSGGQRQRIGIARAIAVEPEILVADEPTSALDVSVQASVLELLRELQERMHFSCIFITHDLAVVDNLADSVVVLQQGHIVEMGATGQVLRHPAEPYTQRLVAAAPIPDPLVQKERAASRRSSRSKGSSAST